MKKILFVCTENSNRSQMAQAFAKIHGHRVVEAFSAGSNPSGRINPKAMDAMREIGYDLSAHQSKSLHEIPQVQWDYIVGMGCGDKCPSVRSKNRIEWSIPDPRDLDWDEYIKVRDLIERHVKELLDTIAANR